MYLIRPAKLYFAIVKLMKIVGLFSMSNRRVTLSTEDTEGENAPLPLRRHACGVDFLA
jgi:hypothetical protein